VTLTIQTHSAGDTFAVGRWLGQVVEAGQVLALHGDLGAGKTTLAQGIAAGMGIAARVTSPTFTLVAEYTGARRLRLVHMDSYRLGENPDAAAQEAATFGLEEILATAALPDSDTEGSVVVIEWAERVAALLPDDRLEIALRPVDDDADARLLHVIAFGPQSAALLARLSEQTHMMHK
jgi:tRNA threonylcarbamoyladenosine biosynthesis protein TsaE